MRRIVEDFEAKLSPIAGRTGSGKIEWERYGNGEVELSARIRKIDVPDGELIELRLDGGAIGTAVIASSRAQWSIASSHGSIVPTVHTGQIVEVAHDGVVVLRGEFQPD